MEDRIIALEARLAHYERLAEELSDVVLQQGRSIDLLTGAIQRLQDRFDDLAWQRAPQDDRPPPHY